MSGTNTHPIVYKSLQGTVSKDDWNKAWDTARGKTRIAANTTLTDEYRTVFCNTDSGAFTVTLPEITGNYSYRIINTGSSGNDVTIAPNGTDNLTGANSSRTLSDSSVIILEDDTTDGWW